MESSKDISEEKVIGNESKKSQSDEVQYPRSQYRLQELVQMCLRHLQWGKLENLQRSRQEEKIKTKNNWPAENVY